MEKHTNMVSIIRYAMGELKLFEEIISSKLGLKSDFVGYETLIDYLDSNNVSKIPGDFMEIGAFMGGGTKKLAQYAKKINRKVYVLDIFDPNFDKTLNERGESMSSIYNKFLGGSNLKERFYQNIEGESNVEVYAFDSKKVSLPRDISLCFSFIDGNHDPSYTEHDFEIAWDKTVAGGIVMLHDYGGDLPQVTQAIQKIIGEHSDEISKLKTIPNKCLISIHKGVV